MILSVGLWDTPLLFATMNQPTELRSHSLKVLMIISTFQGTICDDPKVIEVQLALERAQMTLVKVFWYNFLKKFFGFVNLKSQSIRGE